MTSVNDDELESERPSEQFVVVSAPAQHRRVWELAEDCPTIHQFFEVYSEWSESVKPAQESTDDAAVNEPDESWHSVVEDLDLEELRREVIEIRKASRECTRWVGIAIEQLDEACAVLPSDAGDGSKSSSRWSSLLSMAGPYSAAELEESSDDSDDALQQSGVTDAQEPYDDNADEEFVRLNKTNNLHRSTTTITTTTEQRITINLGSTSRECETEGNRNNDDDAPAAMVASSAAQTFWHEMERFFSSISDEQLRLLAPTKQQHNGDKCFHMPRLGRHYLVLWSDEDGVEMDIDERRDGAATDSLRGAMPNNSTTRHSARLTEHKADDGTADGSRAAEAGMACMDAAMLDLPGFEQHPLAVRMLGAFLDRHTAVTPQLSARDRSTAESSSHAAVAESAATQMVNGGRGSNGGIESGESARPHRDRLDGPDDESARPNFELSRSATQIDRRLQEELYRFGLVEALEHMDPAKFEDDEVSQEIRLKQAELKRQIEVNDKKRAKLQAKIQPELPIDKRRRQAELLDRQFDKAAAKFLKDVKKKGRTNCSDKELRKLLKDIEKSAPNDTRR